MTGIDWKATIAGFSRWTIYGLGIVTGMVFALLYLFLAAFVLFA